MSKKYRYDVIDRKTGQVSLRGATARTIGELLCMKPNMVNIYAENGAAAKKRWLIRRCAEDQVVQADQDEFYRKFGMSAREYDRRVDEIRVLFGIKRRAAV